MIIESLLDLDFYKLTQGQVVFHQFADVEVEYEFRCRNDDIDLLPYKDEIKDEIDHLCELKLTVDEISFLKGIRFLKKSYIEFLSMLRLMCFGVTISEENDKLSIKVKGPWAYRIYFETLILSIVNEVYFRNTVPNPDFEGARKILKDKIDLLICPTKVYFSDFGTRRRFSRVWQEEVVATLKKEVRYNFLGTSNVRLAMINDLTPMGTMAHEYLQCCQALVRVVDSQKYAFECWAKEYRGELGIALSDVVGMDAFLNDFDSYFSKLFDGARHDSGDPFVWCDKLIKHYRKYNIEPITKTALFSDSLTFPLMIELAKKYYGVINTRFGIGTNLTNDIPGVKPINIVMKVVQCNGRPVAKISDSAGKGMCKDQSYLAYLKQQFNIK